MKKLGSLALALVSLFWLTGATWLPLFVQAATSPPSYTFINFFETTASGANISQAFSLGSNSTCRVIVTLSAAGGASSDPITAATMGGTSLTKDITQYTSGGNVTADIWSGNLASCTGSQTLATTSTAGSFSYRSASVWVAINLTVNGHIQAGGYVENAGTKTPATPTISVTANDLMFAASITFTTSTAPTCSSSTQSPAAVHAYTTANYNVAADWVISATNASFSINCDGSANSRAVPVATFH